MHDDERGLPGRTSPPLPKGSALEEADALNDKNVLAALLRRFPGVAWVVDADMRVTAFSSGAALGATPLERHPVGQPLNELLESAGNPQRALAAHCNALTGEVREFHLNWKGREYEARAEPLRSDTGEISGCLCTAVDVTRERALAATVEFGYRFRHALTGLWDEFFDGNTLRAEHYQRVGELALGAVPNAQSVSIWRRLGTEDEFTAVGAVGLNLSAYEGLKFSASELERGRRAGPELTAGYAELEKTHPEMIRQLRSAGPIERIRATLAKPVNVNGEVVAYFHFHNYERADAFGEYAAEMARVFALQLSNLLMRSDLERDLREHQESLTRLVGEYKQLASFGAEIETIHDTEELIERGITRLLDALNFDAALFGDVLGDQLHFTRVRGIADPTLRRRLKKPIEYGKGVNWRAILSGRPAFIESYPSWGGSHDAYRESGIASVLSIPVRRADAVRHVISFATLGRPGRVSEENVRVAEGFVSRLENAFERVEYLREIEATREATFRSLGLALEYRDLETRGHTDRVVELAFRFAEALEMSSELRRALVWGAYLHDIGKIAVPDNILLKPGRLSAAEFEIVKQHTIFGDEMTRDIPFLPNGTREVIRSHHERWDGSGYPDGLAGSDVPLLARMFSLIDVFDALTSSRPYKRAWSFRRAAGELELQAGAQFDPELTERFLKMLHRNRAV